jgi:hypothetical protein
LSSVRRDLKNAAVPPARSRVVAAEPLKLKKARLYYNPDYPASGPVHARRVLKEIKIWLSEDPLVLPDVE